MSDKLSKYNFEVEHDECMLMYNGLTDKLVPVTYQEYSALETLFENLTEFENLYPESYKAFKNAGFIIDDEFDELAYIKLQNKKVVYMNRNYHITINPTLDCNLKCWYCSVECAGAKHGKESMSEDIIEALKKHIYNLINEKKASSILLDWFGGEPMMYYDEVIKPIIKFAKEESEKNNVYINNRITTNATLLNRERIIEMTEYNFNSVQISIDGSEKRHNQIKKFQDKSGTYTKVFENINLISELNSDAYIILRINYDKQTLKDVAELIKDLSPQSRSNITVDLIRVWQVSIGSKERQLLKEAKDAFSAAGFRSSFWAYRPMSFIRCYADNLNHYVVNYDGNIFKCTARDYGEKLVLGNLHQSGEINWNVKLLSEYFEKATFENDMCEACKMLPMCMGPCIQKIYEAKKNKCLPECLYNNVEYELSSYIKDVAILRNLI